MTDMFRGRNIVVVDVETLRSADACLHCNEPIAQHEPQQRYCRPEVSRYPEQYFEAIGWENKRALGLSIGCYYDYRDSALHWFDTHTLPSMMHAFVTRQPLLVSYNGIAFDFALMRALLRFGSEEAGTQNFHPLCDQFKVLCKDSYDVLVEIWNVVPRAERTRGMFTLDAVSQANGYGRKSMTGAEAPRLWAHGRWAEVIAYNAADVEKTRKLFEQAYTIGKLYAGDGRAIALKRPTLPEVEA